MVALDNPNLGGFFSHVEFNAYNERKVVSRRQLFCFMFPCLGEFVVILSTMILPPFLCYLVVYI